MMWIIFLLICCRPTVKGEGCRKTEIIEGRLGTELLLNFSISDLRDEYESEIENQNLTNQTQIKFTNNSMIENIIYKNGKTTYLTGNLTEIFMNHDTLVIKKTKLQKRDAGIYWMKFRSRQFGHKALIIAGKPTIIGRSPSNPVLKPEHNYTSIIQLECDSVSTSVGDCLPTLYKVWYKNGMRMTDVDPTLSQINVTVHFYGGQFTCLATDYSPCYQRLQTTKHYDVLSIEECNDVLKSETFIIIPEFAPMDVKLEPDQREITLNKNDDMKLRCSANCRPKCDVRWEKDYQGFESNGFVNLTENSFENDLVIENVNSSHEGIYVCLVNNIHGEVNKSFTLNIRETKDTALIYAEMNRVIVAVTAVIVIVIVVVISVLIIVFIVIMYKKYRKRKKEILRRLEMRKMPEEWKKIVREPKMIKLETTEDEVACRTMDVHHDTPLPESKDEAWQKWMRKPWDIGAWKKMFGSFETRKLKTAKDEVSIETMDVHRDKLLPESKDEGNCLTTETK